MVQFRPKARELIAKVVYYGPPLGGKTTNLKSLYAGYPKDVRGELVIVPAGNDRTIFFDFLPLEIGMLRGMRVRVQLYTVPGQVHYNATRQVVLRGVDGVVFVADSQAAVLANNRESWENLKDNLLLQGMKLDEVPHVLQYNKRDLGEIGSIEELDALLNDFNAPFFEAVASEGIGVEETLQAIVKLVIRSLRDRFRLEVEQAVTRPIYYPPESTGSGAFGGVEPDDETDDVGLPAAAPGPFAAAAAVQPVTFAERRDPPTGEEWVVGASQPERHESAATFAADIVFAGDDGVQPTQPDVGEQAASPQRADTLQGEVGPAPFELAAPGGDADGGEHAPGYVPVGRDDSRWELEQAVSTENADEGAAAETLEVAEPPFGVRVEAQNEPDDGDDPFEIAPAGAQREAPESGETRPAPDGASPPFVEGLEPGTPDGRASVPYGAPPMDADVGVYEGDEAFVPRSGEVRVFTTAVEEEVFTPSESEAAFAPESLDGPFDPQSPAARPEPPRWGAEAAFAALEGEVDVVPPIADEVETLAPEAGPAPGGPFEETAEREETAEQEEPATARGREPHADEPWEIGSSEAAPVPFAPQRPGTDRVEAHDEGVVLSGDVPSPFEVSFAPGDGRAGEAGAAASAVGPGRPPAAGRKTTRTLAELAALEVDLLGRRGAETGRPVRAASAPQQQALAAPFGDAGAPRPGAEDGGLADPFVVAAPPAAAAGIDDVFAIVPAPPPPAPFEPELVVSPVEIAVRHAASRALARHGEVRELEVEVPVPAQWLGGRRMTFQLRLTLVPQEEDDDR